MGTTKISWTKKTWNPVHGCYRVSEGCRYCYAENLSVGKGFTPKPWTKANLEVNLKLQRHKLREPLGYEAGDMCFVNSMSDLGLDEIPREYLDEVIGIMEKRPDVIFQVLTKRPDTFIRRPVAWPDNVWLGVTIENAGSLWRLDALADIPAKLRWLSCEPLLGSLAGANLDAVDWVVVGGESGLHLRDADRAFRAGRDPRQVSARWMAMEWARELRDACQLHGVPFFFKQDSGWRTELRPWLVEEDGSRWTWHQWPGDLAEPEEVQEEGSSSAR